MRALDKATVKKITDPRQSLKDQYSKPILEEVQRNVLSRNSKLADSSKENLLTKSRKGCMTNRPKTAMKQAPTRPVLSTNNGPATGREFGKRRKSACKFNSTKPVASK